MVTKTIVFFDKPGCKYVYFHFLEPVMQWSFEELQIFLLPYGVQGGRADAAPWFSAKKTDATLTRERFWAGCKNQFLSN